MDKKIYHKPEVELIKLPQGLNLLLNLSVDGAFEDFEGAELEDF